MVQQVSTYITSAALNQNVWQKRVAEMVRSCSAIGCMKRDTQESRSKGKRFYRISVKPDKRRLWLATMQRKDFNPPPDAAICSIHFIGDE